MKIERWALFIIVSVSNQILNRIHFFKKKENWISQAIQQGQTGTDNLSLVKLHLMYRLVITKTTLYPSIHNRSNFREHKLQSPQILQIAAAISDVSKDSRAYMYADQMLLCPLLVTKGDEYAHHSSQQTKQWWFRILPKWDPTNVTSAVNHPRSANAYCCWRKKKQCKTKFQCQEK